MLNQDLTDNQCEKSAYPESGSLIINNNRSKTVLLVENQPDESELLELALDSLSFSCKLLVFPDGTQALDYLRQNEEYPNSLPALMLIKKNLPKLKGIEILQQLRANPKTRYLPVVMFSADTEVANIEQSYHWGCNSYLKKPIDFNKFRTLLSQLISYWLQCNETPYQSYYDSNESTPENFNR